MWGNVGLPHTTPDAARRSGDQTSLCKQLHGPKLAIISYKSAPIPVGAGSKPARTNKHRSHAVAGGRNIAASGQMLRTGLDQSGSWYLGNNSCNASRI